MLALDPNHPLVPQMVQYSLGDQGSRLWRDSHSAGQLAYGLWHYGQKFESESPDFSAQIQLNSQQLWQHKFAGRSDKAVSKRFPVSDLYKLADPKATVPFAFNKTGTGRLYYTATLSYAPSGAASQKARDEGIEVRREILLGDGATPAPKSLQRGEVYLVRLTVVTPKPVFQFMLQDLLPASVEIVQTGFATESSSYDRFLRKKRSESRSGYWWMARAPQYEYRDDRFLATQEYLSPGIHEFYYFARANVRGTVAHPAARAFAMYEPEVFGRTASGTARVR
mgnify:CR=1 FL=1